MKRVEFEYGTGTLWAELPDTTEVFIPGETIPDPPSLEDPVARTKEAILNPQGMPPIQDLVKPGQRVCIVFPDKVKGGFHETSHRRVAIPIIIEESLKAGVKKEDITLICSNGLHRKNTEGELRLLLGHQVFQEFKSQIHNHDSEDWDNLVDLGYDDLGDRVIMNRTLFSSHLPVQIGHTLGNPYGGYSGGYKHVATGITHWKSIASHHIPEVMHREDFTPVTSHSLMQKKFQAIGQHMEKSMGRQFFTCDAVLNSTQRQIDVFAGSCEAILPLSWKVADERTYIPWAQEKFDVMMFGMPQEFHYGNGHGTNPILILQAIAANIIRHRRVLSRRFVVICSSICNGYFHDEEFPSYRELFELYQKDYHYSLNDCMKYGEYFSKKQEYVNKYRYGYGFHPFHAFSMISCGQIALDEASAIYIVGAYEPGYARAMGLKPLATFEEALKDASRYLPEEPRILALPKTFKRAGVHLMMKGDSLS